MKKNHIRTIIIAALVLIAAITMVLRINIEPAKKTEQQAAVSLTAEEAPEPAKEALKATEADVSEKVKDENPQEKKEENAVVGDKKEEEKKETHSDEKKADSEKDISTEAVKIKDEKTAEEKEETKTQAKEQVQAETKKQEETINAKNETKESEKEELSAEVEPEAAAETSPQQHFCTVEIRCDTVVDTKKLENQAVAPYVPESGVILATYKMPFTPGESVFDVLLRATKEKNIHMEFREDNLYSGKYIEGINYLYEMDGGPLSGWMYKVNGKFPNYGCAAYEVKDNDAVVWMYTCDLGMDVGDNSTW